VTFFTLESLIFYSTVNKHTHSQDGTVLVQKLKIIIEIIVTINGIVNSEEDKFSFDRCLL
jgi:hypothetical protein